MAYHRTSVNNYSTVFAKVLHSLLRGSQQPANVGIEHPVKILVREGVDRREFIHTSVVYQHIYFAQSFFGFCKDTLNIRMLRKAALNGERFTAILLDLLYNALGTGLVRSVIHCDCGSCRTERFCNGSTD